MTDWLCGKNLYVPIEKIKKYQKWSLILHKQASLDSPSEDFLLDYDAMKPILKKCFETGAINITNQTAVCQFLARFASINQTAHEYEKLICEDFDVRPIMKTSVKPKKIPSPDSPPPPPEPPKLTAPGFRPLSNIKQRPKTPIENYFPNPNPH